jgi:hypothetical protein
VTSRSRPKGWTSVADELVEREGPAHPVGNDALAELWRVAQGLAPAYGIDANKAFAIVGLGGDFGLSPGQALSGIDLVQGKPRLQAVTLGGFVKKSPVYDFRVTEHTDEKCSIEFFSVGLSTREKESLGTSTFTIAEAKRGGLSGGNWTKWPRNMLYARAMSNGVKWFCPDLMGGIPVYTEGDSFDVIEGSVTEGTGDGTEPEWQGLTEKQISRAEGLIGYAEELGHGGYDRALVKMRLNGQSRPYVDRWLEDHAKVLAEYEQQREPEAAEA